MALYKALCLRLCHQLCFATDSAIGYATGSAL